jgi:hypothetical protein
VGELDRVVLDQSLLSLVASRMILVNQNYRVIDRPTIHLCIFEAWGSRLELGQIPQSQTNPGIQPRYNLPSLRSKIESALGS